MKYLFILFALLLSHKGFAQYEDYKVPYDSFCPELNYCDECGEPKAKFKGILTRYMEKQINWRDIEKINGVVIAQLIIDTNGKVCCHALFNKSMSTVDDIIDLQLDFKFERMPAWEPALKNGEKIVSSVLVAVYSNVSGRPRFFVDYLRNDKNHNWKVATDYRNQQGNFDWDELSRQKKK